VTGPREGSAEARRLRRLDAVRRRLEGLTQPRTGRGRLPKRLREAPPPPVARVPFGGEAFDMEALRG
jgi:hypothetical protein